MFAEHKPDVFKPSVTSVKKANLRFSEQPRSTTKVAGTYQISGYACDILPQLSFPSVKISMHPIVIQENAVQ